MSDPIEVHVFGAKRGESIVLRLPDNQWGVVDAFIPNLRQPERSPLITFLRSRGVENLSFVCLTHPHADHYMGMSYLLENFPPQKIWIFGGASTRHLWKKLAFSIRAAALAKMVDAGDLENSDEFERILTKIQELHKDAARVPRVEVRRMEIDLALLSLDCDPPLRVISIGASGGQALRYEEHLEKCFNAEDGGLARKEPNVNHNMISGGLLIEYGHARVVLGGDIDVAAWEETVRILQPARMRSNLVKVSHHGSSTGYCQGLWHHLSPNKHSVAVLTPFSIQGLPSPEGLAHISQNAKSIYTASVGGAREATDWENASSEFYFQGESLDALLTVRSVFSKTSPVTESLDGCCTFLIHSDGVVVCSTHGEAGCLI